MAEPKFPEATQEQINEGKSIAWLAYLWILFLVPLLAQPENPFSRYHARQGLMLFLFDLALGVVWLILWGISAAIVAVTYGGAFFCIPLVAAIMGILYVLTFVLAIIGIIQSVTGKFWRMPVFGPLAEKWFKNMVPGGGAAPPPPPPPPGE
jgi:uncharacterized membrane protein